MRRSSLAPRIVLIAFASGAIVLSGCPATSERPAEVAGPATETAELETVEVEVAEEEPVASAEGPAATGEFPNATVSAPPNVEAEPANSAASPAVTIERPTDFLRPTLPDTALRDRREEPADSPVEITDRSAEAEDPNSLPGGTPIDDLFEGLEDKPKPESNE